MATQKTYNELHGIEFAKAHRSKINASGHKEHKEAMYYFAKELNEAEKAEAQKSHKIKKLERRFTIESNFAFIIANGIRNGKLKEINDENLNELSGSYCRGVERVDKLAISYSNILEGRLYFTHPNYEKFMDYSFTVLNALESEIVLRNKMKKDKT